MAEMLLREAQSYAEKFGVFTIDKPLEGQPVVPAECEPEILLMKLAEEVGSLAKVLGAMKRRAAAGSKNDTLPPRLIQELLHPLIMILKLANHYDIDLGQAFLEHFNTVIASRSRR